MDCKVSSCSSLIMPCFGYGCSILAISGVSAIQTELLKIMGKIDF